VARPVLWRIRPVGCRPTRRPRITTRSPAQQATAFEIFPATLHRLIVRRGVVAVVATSAMSVPLSSCVGRPRNKLINRHSAFGYQPRASNLRAPAKLFVRGNCSCRYISRVEALPFWLVTKPGANRCILNAIHSWRCGPQGCVVVVAGGPCDRVFELVDRVLSTSPLHFPVVAAGRPQTRIGVPLSG